MGRYVRSLLLMLAFVMSCEGSGICNFSQQITGIQKTSALPVNVNSGIWSNSNYCNTWIINWSISSSNGAVASVPAPTLYALTSPTSSAIALTPSYSNPVIVSNYGFEQYTAASPFYQLQFIDIVGCTPPAYCTLSITAAGSVEPASVSSNPPAGIGQVNNVAFTSGFISGPDLVSGFHQADIIFYWGSTLTGSPSGCLISPIVGIASGVIPNLVPSNQNVSVPISATNNGTAVTYTGALGSEVEWVFSCSVYPSIASGIFQVLYK